MEPPPPWLTLVRANDPRCATLELKGKFMGDPGVQHLAAALAGNTSVTCLDLRLNNVGAAGACRLAVALESNTTLRCLDLGGNDIRRDGAEFLGLLLRQNTTLTSINLENNAIRTAGACALASALESNTAITCLGLVGNGIGRDGTAAFKAALANNHSLCMLKGPVPAANASAPHAQIRRVRSGRLAGTQSGPHNNARSTNQGKRSHLPAACTRVPDSGKQCARASVILIGLKRFRRSPLIQVLHRQGSLLTNSHALSQLNVRDVILLIAKLVWHSRVWLVCCCCCCCCCSCLLALSRTPSGTAKRIRWGNARITLAAAPSEVISNERAAVGGACC